MILIEKRAETNTIQFWSPNTNTSSFLGKKSLRFEDNKTYIKIKKTFDKNGKTF